MTSLIPICACVLALAASSMALGTNFTTDEFLENQGRPEITYNNDVIPGDVMEEGGSGVTPTTPPNQCITEFKACLLEADNWLVKMRCRAKMCGCIKKGDNCGKTLRSCMQKAKGDADKNTTCLQAHNECKERQQGDEEWDSYTTDAAWGY
ncbi:uncharacterized protein LOC116602235 isoform X1 [Nematostella vectensis]|uniref:uncharacterized protein LOC116602235 isoform X1 n=1 Tax=Nematostella vectensis TaxID=45351 RepID=UPI002076E919|nr:uncharacterized protein LOC116602235 isoform X1 [Nematostella vectensis]XP_048577324.1 uncharacterized protein LOC116602235 isoform X1 [Nematostella vectensis]